MGVPVKDFWLAMSRSFPGRIVGVHGGTRATLQAMAGQCGVEPTAGQLDRAVVVQHEGAARVRRARPGVFEVLDELRGRGFLLGLISDCSSELYESWDETAYAARFDAAVFSWREGYRKPGPRLYARVTRQLGVAPRDCWYVGDGGSREHSGALVAGMRPILITNAGYPGAAQHRHDPDTFQPHLFVDDPRQLLDLLKDQS